MHARTDSLGSNSKPGWPEKKSGHSATSRTELTALESSARSKGFGPMARKAAATR
jgi:hypothetical protein